MQVVFHCGVHGTDLSRMVKTLMQNRDWLLKNRIEALPPNKHREIFNDALTALRGGFGAGSHKVVVTFLNDAYDGSPALDRNLYLDAASYNGTAIAGVIVDGGSFDGGDPDTGHQDDLVVGQLGNRSQLRLHATNGQQDAAFAAGLGLGVLLDQKSTISSFAKAE